MKSKLKKSIIPQGGVAQPPEAALMPVVKTAVTHDDIARRAYEIYVEKGRLQGQSEQNWQQANLELRHQM